ncbi:MAG: hypothetical protein CSB33_02755 [Desulfobacterales bacterium]|nr:MAG: hypothetical protein CSB33_02755 [Desulfobacterales bacterium]
MAVFRQNLQSERYLKMKTSRQRSRSGRKFELIFFKTKKEDKKRIGGTIKDIESGWPIGMPVVDSIKGYPGLWEARTSLKNRIARVFYCQQGTRSASSWDREKTQKTPQADIDLANKRMKKMKGMN